MRYSQPFGTPAPPEGQYPRFINGDPITGTEGSIVPGTAVDEDQIEIINVIENVRALGLIGAPGAPSHSDLTQLWQAMNAFFNKQYITTAITRTVHGAGADFPDLNAALFWLSNYIITPTGYVTFLVSPGKWNYTTTIEVNHANIQRVAIQGAAMNANPTGNQLSVTGYGNATDGINQAIYLRACYQTELHFDGGISGFVILRGGLTIRYILLTGDLTVAPGISFTYGSFGRGSGIEAYDRVMIQGVSVWGFGAMGFFVFGAGAIYGDSTISCCACYNQSSGFGGNNGYAYLAGPCHLTSNLGCGFFCYGGNYSFGLSNGRLYGSHVRGNGGGPGVGGVTLEDGAEVNFGTGSNLSQNSGAGAYLAGACTFIGEQITYSYNTNGGAVCVGTSTAWCDDSVFAGNGGFSCSASGCGYLEILRSYVDGAVYSGGYGGVVAGP